MDSVKGARHEQKFTGSMKARAAQCADAGGLLELQKKLLLPIIAEEKEAFISAEFGRLQQIMGVEYTDGEESKVFHPLPGGA